MNEDTATAIAVLDALSGMMGEFHFCVNKNEDGTYSPFLHLCTGNNPRELLATVCDNRKVPRVLCYGCYDGDAPHHWLPVNALVPFWADLGEGDLGCRFLFDELLPTYNTVEELIVAEGREPWWWHRQEKEVYLGGSWPFRK